MAEINKISAFSDASNNPKKALVDSQRRVVVVVDTPILQQAAGIIEGQVDAVPSGVETTIVSFTVPTGYRYRLTGWSATGTADGRFKLYINGTRKMTARNSVAIPNVGKSFSNPIEVLAGVTVSVKVWHSEAAVQEFSAALEGYLVNA